GCSRRFRLLELVTANTAVLARVFRQMAIGVDRLADDTQEPNVDAEHVGMRRPTAPCSQSVFTQSIGEPLQRSLNARHWQPHGVVIDLRAPDAGLVEHGERNVFSLLVGQTQQVRAQQRGTKLFTTPPAGCQRFPVAPRRTSRPHGAEMILALSLRGRSAPW